LNLAFELVFCDLHSSVPFISTYFSPKAIVCYWNDADYEVPAGRDPEFLKNLHVFQQLDELKNILSPHHIPDARGDQSFFWQMYGKVDGNEVGRFASLCKWPLKSSTEQTKPVGLNNLLRTLISRITMKWIDILKQAEHRDQTNPAHDEEFAGDTKMAMGLPKDVPLLPWNESQVMQRPPLERILKNSSPSTSSTANLDQIKIMSANLWLGSEGCYKSGYFAGSSIVNRTQSFPQEQDRMKLLEITARSILNQGVHVVGCQECASLPRDTLNHDDEIDRGELGGRSSVLPLLAQILNKLSGKSTWQSYDQGIVTPGKSSRDPWGILTCLEIIQKTPFGIRVKFPSVDSTLWVFNTHLPYHPYQPFQVEHPPIPYEGDPVLTTEKEAILSSQQTRGNQVNLLLQDIQTHVQSTDPIVIMGDFNEPSHLDWTNEGVIAGYHPIPVRWHCTHALHQQGYRDAYRTYYPNPLVHPGFTWCTYDEELAGPAGHLPGWRKDTKGKGNSASCPRDRADRIDFLYFKGMQLNQVGLMGPKQSGGFQRDLVEDGLIQFPMADSEWVSDHRAIVASFHV
jgi:hypothetical protein